MRKTRLAFVCWAPRVSGIEVALAALLENMDYDRFDVTVLFTTSESYDKSHESTSILSRLDARAHVYVADRTQCASFKARYRFNLLRRIGGYLYWKQKNPLARKVGARLLNVENDLYSRYIRRGLGAAADVDTVILYHPFATEEGVRVFNYKRFVLVYHCGGQESIHHQELGFEAADTILSVGRRVADDIRSWFPQYAAKVDVAENLVDVSHILAMAEEPPSIPFAPKDVLHIVTCARLDFRKGIDLALDAMAKLVADGITNFHYHVIGWDQDAALYEAQLKRLHLEPYVTLHGHNPNPYPMMKRADIYLQPSKEEAFGLTIAEALLLNRPVVSTRSQGGIDLLSEPGVKGTLCDISADAIAEALKPLLASRAARDALCNSDYRAHCERLNRERLARFESFCTI